jgi:hypothetical protein
MILDILKHTPLWVFGLFGFLVYLGVLQSRTRSFSPARLAILPAAMLAFSLYGVLSVFGASVPALGAWLAGLAASVWAIVALRLPRDATWSEATRTFSVPGSWLPLGIMMAIFFTRYAVNVGIALDPSLKQAAGFLPAVALTYGVSSGYFLARALNISRRRLKPASPAPSAAA